MENHLKTAIEIAREAGDLLLQHFRQPLEITYKRRSDLVTEADRRSETLIVERLRSHFPDHAIVAEEGGGQETGSDYCWYAVAPNPGACAPSPQCSNSNDPCRF